MYTEHDCLLPWQFDLFDEFQEFFNGSLVS